MKTPPAKSGGSGFTLIELLVMICVIAVLAALLLRVPSGGGRSKMGKCMSNLKQIDLGLLLFAGDNHDRYPMQVPVGDGGNLSTAIIAFRIFKN